MRNVLGIMLFLVAGLSISQAAAVPLGNPEALKLAIKEGGLTEKVHCVPGWYHHSYGDGCYGGGYYGGGYYRGYRGVYRGGVYRGVYRGGVYRGGYRGGVYRGGYRGAAYRGGAAFRGGGYRGGGRVGGRGGGRRSDIQLKHDIMLLGYLQNGIPFYRFSYNGSEVAHVGVMAQDVQKVEPRAVTKGSDGYLRVYYERLGLRFQTYSDWMAAGGHVPAGGTR
jgi:Chaperone of endosialidase